MAPPNPRHWLKPNAPPAACSECRFWHNAQLKNVTGREQEGWCRRRAPVVEDGLVLGRWPATRFDSLCGEFERKPG